MYGVDVTGLKVTVSFQVISIFLLYIPSNLESREYEILFEKSSVLVFCVLYDAQVIFIGDFIIPSLYENPNEF